MVVAIETELKKREAAGLLLLPDLSALANSTVGIFSDYSGEGPGSKRTDWIRHFDRRYNGFERIRSKTGCYWKIGMRKRTARRHAEIQKNGLDHAP